jgi:hypothetical protein
MLGFKRSWVNSQPVLEEKNAWVLIFRFNLERKIRSMIKSHRLPFIGLLLSSLMIIGCWKESTTNSTEPVPDVPPTSRADDQVGSQSGGQDGVPGILPR